MFHKCQSFTICIIFGPGIGFPIIFCWYPDSLKIHFWHCTRWLDEMYPNYNPCRNQSPPPLPSSNGPPISNDYPPLPVRGRRLPEGRFVNKHSTPPKTAKTTPNIYTFLIMMVFLLLTIAHCSGRMACRGHNWGLWAEVVQSDKSLCHQELPNRGQEPKWGRREGRQSKGRLKERQILDLAHTWVWLSALWVMEPIVGALFFLDAVFF